MLGISRQKILTEISEWEQLYTLLQKQEAKVLKEALGKYGFEHPSQVAQIHVQNPEILTLTGSAVAFHQIIQAGIPSILTGLDLLNNHFQDTKNVDLLQLDSALIPEIFIPLKTIARKIDVIRKLQKDNNQLQYKYEIAITQAQKKIAAFKTPHGLIIEKDTQSVEPNKMEPEDEPLLKMAHEELNLITLLTAPKIEFCKKMNDEYEQQLKALTTELIYPDLLKAPKLLMDYFETIFDCEDTYAKLQTCKRDLQTLVQCLETTPPPVQQVVKFSDEWDKDFEEDGKPLLLANKNPKTKQHKKSRNPSEEDALKLSGSSSSFNSADWGVESEESEHSGSVEELLAKKLVFNEGATDSVSNLNLSPPPSYLPQLATTTTGVAPSLLLPTSTSPQDTVTTDQKPGGALNNLGC